jgi:hypothetical protein
LPKNIAIILYDHILTTVDHVTRISKYQTRDQSAAIDFIRRRKLLFKCLVKMFSQAKSLNEGLHARQPALPHLSSNLQSRIF